VRQAKEVLAEHPEIRHGWSIDDDEDHCILEIPEQCDGGFAVTAEVYPDEITVAALGAHTHLVADPGAEEVVGRALGLVRDLLSPAMRIRERLASGEPYRWAFETYESGVWVVEEWSGFIFWNYFGKRSEKFYQNRLLPARPDAS